MDKTQLVSIEIGTECNLGKVHGECPNRSPDRYKFVDTQQPLSDAKITEIVSELYAVHGFRGLVAWHYYNEPLCQMERMFALMAAIKSRTAKARFLLWTNGLLFPEDLTPFKQFERIVITDYGLKQPPQWEALQRQQSGVKLCRWKLDKRLQMYGDEDSEPCARMYTELIIDFFGNVRLCCYDWRGWGCVANVHSHSTATIVARWQQIRERLSGTMMDIRAPKICLHCNMKHSGVGALLRPDIFVPEAVQAAEADLRRLRSIIEPPRLQPLSGPLVPVADRKVAVVFVSYLKVPARRRKDHFRWNGDLYRAAKAKVYVVMEKMRRLPPYAEAVIVPESDLPVIKGKRRFSLCKTKNAGLERALADGADVIICTDVDMAYPLATWKAMVAVPDNVARVPVYCMIPSLSRRNEGELDHGATGTIAMTAANWRQVRYDERCVGYGADDGIILHDIKTHGLTEDRSQTIWHVEHPGATPASNNPGHGRSGCYGRDGFNFDNFLENRKLLAERKKSQAE